MNFSFSEEQEEFRRSIRRFFEEKSPSSEVRRIMELNEGYDSRLWDQMASQLDLLGLNIPEIYGGLGYGHVELGIVQEELGRCLACVPFFSTVVLGATLLLVSGDEKFCSVLLPKVVSGEVKLAVCIGESENNWGLEKSEAAVSPGFPPVLNGTKRYVIDGTSATHFLVFATDGIGLSLYLIDGTEESIEKTSLGTLDLTRKLSDIKFSDTPAILIGTAGAGDAYFNKMMEIVLVQLACEQVGGAQRVLEMAVQYSKDRSQFGRPIGSFQAIKHKCAEMLVEVEFAKSAAYYGAWALDNAPEEFPTVSYLAKAFCSEAYFQVAAENIQIHGGIGFTWEHDAHLYFKRAKTSELLFGTPAYYREKLAQQLDL